MHLGFNFGRPGTLPGAPGHTFCRPGVPSRTFRVLLGRPGDALGRSRDVLGTFLGARRCLQTVPGLIFSRFGIPLHLSCLQNCLPHRLKTALKTAFKAAVRTAVETAFETAFKTVLKLGFGTIVNMPLQLPSKLPSELILLVLLLALLLVFLLVLLSLRRPSKAFEGLRSASK